ncbi:3'-5' exonuclease [Roseomonas gilardii]|uniref:3'-5' exonuclease n=1 Tax=Roseomonas gilardii TaxID=257708 RepID=UPI0004B6DECB|nr:hypothetical protein [Roseomonas gilardii]SUE63190.1 Uncharacterised protein [Roseomonas gilardii subsp. rosea]
MAPPTPLLFLDFEASSLLPGTFPIEVGWCTEAGQVESHLIHPGAFPQGQWSFESEAIHGISQERLCAEGRPAVEVAHRFLEVAAGKQVVVSSLQYDGMWLKLLLETIDAPVPALVSDRAACRAAATNILLAGLPPEPGSDDHRNARYRTYAAHDVCRAAEEAHLDDLVIHRAGPDAEAMFKVWQTTVRLATGRRGRLQGTGNLQ